MQAAAWGHSVPGPTRFRTLSEGAGPRCGRGRGPRCALTDPRRGVPATGLVAAGPDVLRGPPSARGGAGGTPLAAPGRAKRVPPSGTSWAGHRIESCSSGRRALFQWLGRVGSYSCGVLAARSRRAGRAVGRRSAATPPNRPTGPTRYEGARQNHMAAQRDAKRDGAESGERSRRATGRPSAARAARRPAAERQVAIGQRLEIPKGDGGGTHTPPDAKEPCRPHRPRRILATRSHNGCGLYILFASGLRMRFKRA